MHQSAALRELLATLRILADVATSDEQPLVKLEHLCLHIGTASHFQNRINEIEVLACLATLNTQSTTPPPHFRTPPSIGLSSVDTNGRSPHDRNTRSHFSDGEC